jgi:hypothetical protein
MTKLRQPRYADIFKDNEEMFETAKAKWAEAVSHLDDNGLTTTARVSIADRYARAYAEYEYLYPIAAKEGPITKGPNGGDVFNFNWSAVEKLNERIAKLEAKLKMDVDGETGGKAPEVKKTAADSYLG